MCCCTNGLFCNDENKNCVLNVSLLWYFETCVGWLSESLWVLSLFQQSDSERVEGETAKHINCLSGAAATETLTLTFRNRSLCDWRRNGVCIMMNSWGNWCHVSGHSRTLHVFRSSSGHKCFISRHFATAWIWKLFFLGFFVATCFTCDRNTLTVTIQPEQPDARRGRRESRWEPTRSSSVQLGPARSKMLRSDYISIVDVKRLSLSSKRCSGTSSCVLQ